MASLVNTSDKADEIPSEVTNNDVNYGENGDTGDEEACRNDLARLEEEIRTLKSVLQTKERQVHELKRRLGITTMMEWRNDLTHGLQTVKESQTVQKTNEKMHQIGDSIASSEAYQKTNAAFKSVGSFAYKKIGDMRNSGVFKSVEDKIGGAYQSVKSQFSADNSTADSLDHTPH